MGSGEADAISVTVIGDHIEPRTERRHQSSEFHNQSSTGPNLGTVTIGNVSTGYIGDYWQPSTYFNTYPSTIYMYQIKCPRCSTMTFMQLEFVTPCKKCHAKLKATTKQYEYEVPVEL